MRTRSQKVEFPTFLNNIFLVTLMLIQMKRLSIAQFIMYVIVQQFFRLTTTDLYNYIGQCLPRRAAMLVNFAGQGEGRFYTIPVLFRAHITSGAVRWTWAPVYIQQVIDITLLIT